MFRHLGLLLILWLPLYACDTQPNINKYQQTFKRNVTFFKQQRADNFSLQTLERYWGIVKTLKRFSNDYGLSCSDCQYQMTQACDGDIKELERLFLNLRANW